MLSITKTQLVLIVPNCTMVATLQDKLMTDASGTFYGLDFAVEPDKVNVQGVTYSNISSHEAVSTTHNDIEFSFHTNLIKVAKKSKDKNFFSLTITQGKEQGTQNILSILPKEIYLKLDFESAMLIYPNGSDMKRNKLVSILLTKNNCENDDLADEDFSSYETHYYRDEENNIRKTVKKYGFISCDKHPMDLTEEELQQLNFDRLGFRDLQIILE
jgi:hypothetical protein